jgi:hypothetical protein
MESEAEGVTIIVTANSNCVCFRVEPETYATLMAIEQRGDSGLLANQE